MDFDASASSDGDGSIVSFDYDFDGDGSYDALNEGPQVQHVYSEAGAFNARLRVSDNEGASDTDFIEINCAVAANQAPVAALSASPAAGPAPLLVTLDAGSSTDSDGSVVSYDFDLDGDGIFELQDAAASFQHSFSAPGSYAVSVRVWDDQGSADIGGQSVEVQNTPPTVSLDPA